MKEIKLPSGAILKITLSPFSESKALYQAILEELKQLELTKDSVENFLKNFACVAFSSKKIEQCLEVCFKRCTYDCGKGELKIDKDTFEPLENRGDYIDVCVAVVEENVAVFMKSLYAKLEPFLPKAPSSPA